MKNHLKNRSRWMRKATAFLLMTVLCFTLMPFGVNAEDAVNSSDTVTETVQESTALGTDSDASETTSPSDAQKTESEEEFLPDGLVESDQASEASPTDAATYLATASSAALSKASADLSITPMATATVSVEVRKVWNDGGDTAGKRPNRVTVQLLRNGESLEDVDSLTLLPENEWNATWEGLLRDESYGIPYTYSVKELSVPDGYVSSSSSSTDDDGDFYITVTNTYVTDLTVTVAWENDEDNVAGTRPDAVTVQLNQTVNDVTTSVGSVSLSEGDGVSSPSDAAWASYTWEDLPMYDETYAAEITYSVAEEDVPGYTTEISDPETGSDGEEYATITNTLNYEDKSLSLEAQKYLDNQAPGDSTFHFVLTDVTGESESVIQEDAENDTEGQVSFDPITYTLSDYDKPYKYTVSEKDEMNSAYTYSDTVYDVSVTPGIELVTPESGDTYWQITAEPEITANGTSVDSMVFYNTTADDDEDETSESESTTTETTSSQDSGGESTAPETTSSQDSGGESTAPETTSSQDSGGESTTTETTSSQNSGGGGGSSGSTTYHDSDGDDDSTPVTTSHSSVAESSESETTSEEETATPEALQDEDSGDMGSILTHNSDGTLPKTGDHSRMPLWFSVLLFAGILTGAGFLLRKMSRRSG